MSRENRRTESVATRLALAERDLEVHDDQFAELEKRDDEQDARLDALEDRSSANRAGMWANITAIVVAGITLVGGIIAVVVK